MSEFMLEPVDGGSSIPLPQGETLLGRGPFLGVSDKRVSRHHGMLQLQGGQLCIKPTHLNPCFRQASLDDPPEPLEKDRWHPLHPGDLFSLMPGKYVYRVLASAQDNTQRNSQMTEEEEAGKESPHPNGQSDPITPGDLEQGTVSMCTVFRGEDHNPPPQKTSAGDSGSGNEARPKVVERKRVLPAWMLQAVGWSPSVSTGVEKKAVGKTTPSQAKRPLPRQASNRMVSSGDESEESETEQACRKRAKRKSEEEEGVQPEAGSSSATTARRPTRRILVESSGESDGGELGTEEERRTTGPTSQTRPWKRRKLESLEDEEQEEGRVQTVGGDTDRGGSDMPSQGSQAMARSRTPCVYGKACYRKNPVHFKECSHPGDSDYEELVSEEDDAGTDRPECPYGTSCYRKNPQHKKEYKHTKDPGKGAGAKKLYTEVDDYEDSFSDDVDDDSDYLPPESDDGADAKRRRKALRK